MSLFCALYSKVFPPKTAADRLKEFDATDQLRRHYFILCYTYDIVHVGDNQKTFLGCVYL